jgi:hypothetical protein
MADALNLSLGVDTMPSSNTASSFTNVTLNGGSDGATKVAWVFYAQEDATVTHVGYRQGVTTLTPGSGSYRAVIQGVSTSTGQPDGSDAGTTAVTFTPTSGNDGTWQWVALANSLSVTRGNAYAIVIENTGVQTANYISVTTVDANTGFGTNIPYSTTYASSTWTKGSNGFRCPVWGYKSSTQVFGRPYSTVAVASNVTTSGNRAAMKFTLPAGWGSTFKVIGARGKLRSPTTGTSFVFGLWNAAGTALQSITLDSDIQRSGNVTDMELWFSGTLATLDFGTTYYIGLESVSSSSVSMVCIDVQNADDRDAWPLSTNRCYAVWDGSDWDAETTTKLPVVDLILSDITEPTGGAGGPAMLINGGLVQ